MIRNLWVAWGWMVAAVVANALAAWLYPPAVWVTAPAAIFLVLHYGRVMWRR